jgi:pSer/pThr/pTyr-binding forkhead associated (FHA) protein
MHLVVPAGGSFREVRRIELGERELTIGRAEACEVHIDVPGVDDEHAKISLEALTAIGTDCAVGDVPLDAGHRRLVAPGDEIQIGSVVVVLDGSVPTNQQRPGPRIRVVEGENSGHELLVMNENHEYIIGRSPKVDLVLNDREVSREHLKIVRRGIQIFIYYQASTRGSWLGRSAVYQGSVIEWDAQRMLKIGATVLSLDLPDGMRPPTKMPPALPMTLAPRVQKPVAAAFTPAPGDEAAGPPPNVVAYHYEAKQPAAGAGAAAAAKQGMPAIPADEGTLQMPSAPPLPPGIGPTPTPTIPPARQSAPGSRAGWKKTGPRIGRASGLLLLALAGLAILGVLFVVFSLME